MSRSPGVGVFRLGIRNTGLAAADQSPAAVRTRAVWEVRIEEDHVAALELHRTPGEPLFQLGIERSIAALWQRLVDGDGLGKLQATVLESLRIHDWMMIQASNTGIHGRALLESDLEWEDDPLRRLDLIVAVGSARDNAESRL